MGIEPPFFFKFRKLISINLSLIYIYPMPHNFDLSAFITKNPDDNNKLVIQLKITDIMAYNQSGNWGNNDPQQSGAELTWEERNFMEEEEHQHKPDFSEYEWMMDLEEFDSQAMQRIEQDDDLDDMFYWDPSKGCTEGKNSVAKKNHQSQNLD